MPNKDGIFVEMGALNGIKFSSCPSASIQYPIDAKSDKNIQLNANGYIKLIECSESSISVDHIGIKN